MVVADTIAGRRGAGNLREKELSSRLGAKRIPIGEEKVVVSGWLSVSEEYMTRYWAGPWQG
jgi:hypothetical protein